MKLSVSLPEEDVEFIDGYLARRGAASRSAAVQDAIELLRAAELEDAYTEAFEEWADEETQAWEQAVADGIDRGDPE